MTDLRQAAQQLLDWLYENDIVHPSKVSQDLRTALEQQAEPTIYVGAIGHVDHGKTSLAAAIAPLLRHLPAAEAQFQQQAEPVCPKCKAGVLYECVACSSNNYPPQRKPLTDGEIAKALPRPWPDEGDRVCLSPTELRQFAHGIKEPKL